jgi:threonine/homoserine/homoserine lactone efflux protein
MLPYILSGLTFGASAGFSPGPLQTLVISATLRHNLKEGLKTAFAPILTDAPIVIFSVFILSQLSEMNRILGGISICGGFFLIYLGCESFRIGSIKIGDPIEKPKSIQKAAITNLLNPHPYVFWFSVGAPMFVNAARESTFSAIVFITLFYVTIVSAFMLTAFLVSRFRRLLQGKFYVYTMRALGLILILFSILFFRSAFQFFGWL